MRVRAFSVHVLVALPIAACLLIAPGRAAAAGRNEAAVLFGRYCARCHGTDGAGTGATSHPATRPMNFRDCGAASGEPAGEWIVAVREGGRAAGRSHEMPSFGEELSEAEIRALVGYVRSFCEDQGYPSGDLNLPRPMTTEKAFPEDEVVFAPVISHASAERTIALETEVEKRVGRRAMVEASLPAAAVSPGGGASVAGVGDISLAFKTTLLASRAASHILSAGVEVTVPTAAGAAQIGHDTTIVEPFIAAALRKGPFCLQGSLGIEVPARQPPGEREVGYGIYVGRTLSERSTAWTVGAEVSGENGAVALTPQVRKGLTKTGALAAAMGVAIPLNAHDEQPLRWVGYLLWDYTEPVRARR